MKSTKCILYILMIGLTLFAQLINPILVRADDQTPPTGTPTPQTVTPTETSIEPTITESPPPPTDTPVPTDTPHATNTPTDTVITETPIASDTDIPTAEAVTPTDTPLAIDTPTVEAPAPSDTPTEAISAPANTSTPLPTDQSSEIADSAATESTAATTTEDQPPLFETIPDNTDLVVLDQNGDTLSLATQQAADIIAIGDPIWCPGTQVPTFLADGTGTNGCSNSYGSLSALANGFVPTEDGTIWIQSGSIGGASVTINGNGNWAAAKNFDLNLYGGWNGSSGSGTITDENSIFQVPISIKNWIGNLTVNNLTVKNTNKDGLEIRTEGDVNLDTVTSKNNEHRGVVIDSGGNVTMKAVTIEMNGFSTNNWAGVRIDAKGTIELTDVKANQNGATGINVTSSGNVTMNSITANKNGNGLTIVSNGVITANNLTASKNTNYGTYLNNTNGTGDVSLTGANTFNNNSNTGLYILSNGAITTNNIMANTNGSNGVYISSNGSTTLNTITAGNNASNGVSISSSGNVDLQNIVTNNNAVNGLLINSSQPVSINNIVSQGNCTGLNFIDPTNNLAITSNDSSISYNIFGLQVSDVNFQLLDPAIETIVSNNNYNFTGPGANCDSGTPGLTFDPFPVFLFFGTGNFKLNCAQEGIYEVHLPNDDTVWIYCPVSGEASIARLDNNFLPDNLPQGFTYASAFSLDINQNDQSIPLINEGGHIKASFVAQPGKTYSILYWNKWALVDGHWVDRSNKSMWMPLKKFMLDENGRPHIFALNPGDVSDEGKKIISGVNVVNENGTLRVEVSTNFTGTFVLAEN